MTKIWKVTPKLLKSSFQTNHSKRKSRIPWMISWPNASQTVSGKKDYSIECIEQNYRGLRTHNLDIIGHPSQGQVLLIKGVANLRGKHLASLQGNFDLNTAAKKENWKGSGDERKVLAKTCFRNRLASLTSKNLRFQLITILSAKLNDTLQLPVFHFSNRSPSKRLRRHG